MERFAHKLIHIDKDWKFVPDISKKEIQGRHFIFEVYDKGEGDTREGVGCFKITIYSRPFKFVKITNIDTYIGHRGNGVGTYMREKLFDFLDKNDLPAALTNTASFNYYQEGKGRKRYWKELIPGNEFYLYYKPHGGTLSESERNALIRFVK